MEGDDGDDSGNFSDSTAKIFHFEENQLIEPHDQKVAGVIVRLKDSSGQEQSLAAIGSVEWILVEVESYESSWQMIPAENLIAAAQST